MTTETLKEIRTILTDLTTDAQTRCSQVRKIVDDAIASQENPFHAEAIQWMKQNFGIRFRGSALWVKSFAHYNAKHGTMLDMRCAPCYSKVLNFIIVQAEMVKVADSE